MKSRIAVFDSGIGGLSVLSELQKILPSSEYYYCLDNAFYPYGTKTEEELIQRLTKLLPIFVRNCDARILVLACNTASTLALEAIRSVVNIPVVGVVPAIKPAANLSKSRVIGLLATEATVRRKYTDSLISDFAKDCELIKIGSRKLVDIAEAKIRGDLVSLSEISSELAPFFKHENLDTIVLACTHFDHLREEFEKLAPRDIRWVSSAGAVALRTKTLAEELGLKELDKKENRLIGTQVAKMNLHTLSVLFKRYGFAFYQTLIV